MLRVTSHDEFVALQQRFVRDYMAALMHGSLQLVAAIQRRTVDQMLPAFDQYVEQLRLKVAAD